MRYLRVYVGDIQDTLVICVPESKVSIIDFCKVGGEWTALVDIPGVIDTEYCKCDPMFYDDPFENDWCRGAT